MDVNGSSQPIGTARDAGLRPDCHDSVILHLSRIGLTSLFAEIDLVLRNGVRTRIG
jgi:hypothetical protein